MKWLRLHAKKLSVLALFALALQFGASFGHHHAELHADRTELADRAPSSAPDTDHETTHHRDLCAICVAIALANALIGTPPPALPALHSIELVSLRPAQDSGLAALRVAGFQSRAPPRS